MSIPRTSWLVAAMIVAVAAISMLAWWDEQREAALALDEFADHQATLAAATGAALRSRIDAHPDEDLFVSLGRIERPGDRVVLLARPRTSVFETADGRTLEVKALQDALDSGATTMKLLADDAARLGLPPRSAWAGLARVKDPRGGRWGVAVITSARTDRDRAARGKWRLMLSTLLAAGLVFAFGGLALRERARELEAQKSLALAQLERERDERLQRENKAAMVITLASGIAHEVATPLSVIVGRAEQLKTRANGDERSQRAVSSIIEQAERIDGVVRGFLGLARGKPPTLAAVAPSAVVAGALDLVEHRFTKAGVRVASHVSPALPEIHCDRRLLEQALVNLLLNACDASHRGGHVEIDARVSEGAVVFEVSDDGEGIAPEVAARATEPFFTTKGEGGTGLGLAIANEIVKTHRGSLAIAPQRTRGTRVSVQIPLAAPEAQVLA